MPDALDQLVEKLRNALGQDLVSVVLYGSAAVGDHHGKFSDYNVLCVLSSVTPAQLARYRNRLPLVARKRESVAAAADRG